MARRRRMELPDIPQHVIQRGNNRQPCFFTDDDYRFYLACLHEAAKRYACAVHAYVLMTNHVHLLATPSTSGGLSRLMQTVGRRYVRYVNYQYRRTGTLWEGRYKASLVDSESYLLTCYRYIELNPVRAGMAADPGDYSWSSYGAHALSKPDPVITDHAVYLARQTADTRAEAYRALCRYPLGTQDLEALRSACSRNNVLGNARFKEQIEAALKVRVGPVKMGRPRKAERTDMRVAQ